MDETHRKKVVAYAEGRLGYVLETLVPDTEIHALTKPDGAINVVVAWLPTGVPSDDVIRATFKVSAAAAKECLLHGFSTNDDRAENRLAEVITRHLEAHRSSVAKEHRGKLVIWQIGVEELRTTLI